MKIGYFSDTYHPQINGVVMSIDLFREELIKHNHQVYVFAPAFKSDLRDRTKITPVIWGDPYAITEEDVFRFRSMSSIFVKEYPLAIPLSLRTTVQISKLDLDIAHSHDPFTLGVFADLVSYSKNIPLVHTYHTLYPDYLHYVFKREYKVTKKISQRLSATYCNRTDHVIAPSDKLKHLLQDFGVTTPITTIPTGIKLKRFEHLKSGFLQKKYHIPLKTKKMLFIGRLGKEKNVEFLLQVARIISSKQRDVYLIVIGDGPNRKALEELAHNLDISDHVKFTGYLSHDEVIQTLADVDVFVFSSLTDTQGVVLFEAAAASLPIVMVRDEGLSDIVVDNHNGFITSEDYGEFASRVELLFSNAQLSEKMGKRSQNIVQHFSIENQTRILQDLYERVIEGHTSANWRAKYWRELRKELPLEKLNKLRKLPLRLPRLFNDNK